LRVTGHTGLNVYLLKSTATPAEAVPALAGGHIAHVPLDQATVDDPDVEGNDDQGWLETWIVNGDLVPGVLPTERNGTAALLVRATPASPRWLATLRNLVPAVPLAQDQMNFGALFFQPIGSEMLLWTFGNGWMLIDPNTTVDRFGLRVGLNALLSVRAPAGSARAVGVRELTSALRATVVRKATVVTARPSSPRSMERLDQTSDAATMAQLTTHHPTFDRIAAGRSLRFDAPVDSVHDLTRYGVQAIRLHRRADYQSHDDYKWIDHTVPVSDPSEVDAVLDELWAQASSTPPLDVDLVWSDSDLDTGITPATVRLPNERGKVRRPDLTWATVLAWFQYYQSQFTGHLALRTRLRFFNEPPIEPVASGELWQYLVAQIAVAGQTYIVSDGEVWRASASYIQDIDAELTQHVDVNPTHLPRYLQGELEDAYNTRAAQHGNHLLIDKALLRLPGQTPIEAADLLSTSGLMMHVKRKSRSSTMSHAAAQALGSAQLLRSHALARQRLEALIDASGLPAPTLDTMRAHCAAFAGRPTVTVQIVIVGSWRGAPHVSQLPLLTRINLNGWTRQMTCDRRIVLVGT
jgi:uncharacterized protein (TIGR04141 family)